MGNEIEVKSRLEGLVRTESIQKRFKEVLKDKAATFLSSVISASKANPALEKAEPMSLLSAAMIAATLDLPINPSLGFAHLIPFSGNVQFVIGWKGIVQLALRSNQYKTIHPTIIYEGQITKHNRFTGEMEFKDEKKSDKPEGYLLYFKLLNGFEKFFYMTKGEVEVHGKKYSQMFKAGKGFWVTDFDNQALKTVIKLGLAKFGPLSVEMQKAFTSDEGVIDVSGEVKEYPDNIPDEPVVEEAQTTSSRLKQAIDVAPTPSEIETKKKLKEQAESLKNEPHEPVKAPKVGVGELTLEKVSQIKSQMDICTNTENLTEFYNSLGQEAMNHPDIKPYYASNWKMLKSAKK